MAPKTSEKKRRNKRKARTEVSSSSSSSDSEQEQQQEPSVKNTKAIDRNTEETALNSDSDEAPVFTQKKFVKDPEEAFDEFYLRQATREFANDLDKLRSAGDFNEKSIPLLIAALKQGTACFSPEEKRRITETVTE